MIAINHDPNIVKFQDPRLNTGNDVTTNQTNIHIINNTKYHNLYFFIDFLSIIADATISPKKNARTNDG